MTEVCDICVCLFRNCWTCGELLHDDLKYVLFVSVCSENAGLVVNCYVMNKVRDVCVCSETAGAE